MSSPSPSAALLIGLLGETSKASKAELTAYQLSVAKWPGEPAPASASVTSSVAKLIASLDKEIEAKQGEHTYIRAKTVIERVVALQSERDHATRTINHLKKLSDSLTAQASEISSSIRAKVQALLDTLQSPMPFSGRPLRRRIDR